MIHVQRMNSSAGGLPGRLDPDVATLSLCVDQHMAALTKDAVVSDALCWCMHMASYGSSLACGDGSGT